MISENIRRMAKKEDIADILNRLHELPGIALFNSNEAAIYINVSPSLLRAWRWRGCGPRFVGNGHLVRYPKENLDTYLVEGTAPELPPPESAA